MARPKLGEDDPDVKKWLNVISQQGTGSPETREAYLFSIDAFMRWSNTKGYYKSPSDFVEHAKEDIEATEFRIAEFFNYLEKERGLSRNTCVRHYAALRSMLSAFGVELKGKMPKSWNTKPPSIPTKEELRKFLLHADLRMRAMILCQRDSGLSNQELLKLRYSDVRKDLEAGKDSVCVTSMRDKEKVWFSTFFGPETVEALKEYLETRRKGTKDIPPEALGDDSPLWRARLAEKRSLGMSVYKDWFWRVSKEAGIAIHPHMLRKFFSTTMKLAGVNDSLVEYWMGHTLSDSKQPYLVPAVDKQREVYMRAYPQLALTYGLERTKEEAVLVAVRKFAEAWGVDPMRVRIEKTKELGREPSADEEIELLQTEIKKMRGEPRTAQDGNGHFETALVTEKELVPHLNRGWDLVKELNSGKIVIRRSTEISAAVS